MSFRQFLTELVHLHDVEKTKPGIINSLLNKRIVVNIKIDQMAFVVMRDGDKLRFFGREGKDEITKVKRVGMDLYKKPIAHLEKQDWKKLPDGVMIFLENFNDKLKSIMRYTEKPKNDLIISYCKEGSKFFNPADPINQKVADILDVAPPPVLFDGKLSATQKKQLLAYLANPSGNFLEFITSLFVTPEQLKYLIKENFEGLVFYLDSEEVPSAKLVDPNFTSKILDKKETENVFYEVLLGLIFKHTDSAIKSVISLPTLGDNKDERYINFIGQVSLELFNEHKDEFIKMLSSYKDEVEAKRFANVDYDLIENALLQKIIHQHFWVEELFRALLFMLSKSKKRADPKSGITAERKDKINDWVKKIDERISS